MPKTKFLVLLVGLSALLSCSLAPARMPIDPATKLALSVIDTPASPLITAHLSQQNNFLVISGEVHKRNTTSLNGCVFLRIIGPDGQELWHKRAELVAAGLRLQRYRLFEEKGPLLPPAGSTVIIEFQKLDLEMDAEVLKPNAQTPMTL